MLAEWAQRGGGGIGHVGYTVDDGGRVGRGEGTAPAEHHEQAER